MSNFTFMNNKQFLKHPACKRIYDYVILAEQAYQIDHEKCAIKVRFVLEQFCIFVSELKQAEYPFKISMLGNYWCRENKFVFIQAFGLQNFEYIKQANIISCSYLHSELVPREDIYPEMMENIFKLLLWLYKELGFVTNEKYSDYSVSRIPENKKTLSESSADIYYSSEEMLENLKKFYPNCNMDALCNVEKNGDRYNIKDLNGNVVAEFVTSEQYDSMEEEKEIIKMKLEEVSYDFKFAQSNFQTEQKEKNRRIKELNEKINLLFTQKEELSVHQKEELSVLQQQISEMERDKQKAVSEYKTIIRQLGEQYDILQEKYENLIPLEEQRKQLQKQVKILLNERKVLQDNFNQKEYILLEEISKTKVDLCKMEKNIEDMKISSTDSKELISDLKQKLLEKEKELKYTQNLSDRNYNQLQEETIKKIREYENKANDLEIIITYLMTENAKYKEMLSAQDKVAEAKQYLQIVNHGISQIKDGYMLYQRNANEETLRRYLLKVKNHYEAEIEGLKEDLQRKEEELEQEKLKNQKMMQDWWDDVSQTTEEYSVEQERRKRKYSKSKIAMRVAILFTAFGVATAGLIIARKIQNKRWLALNNELATDEEIMQEYDESVQHQSEMEELTFEEYVVESETISKFLEETTTINELMSETEVTEAFSTEELKMKDASESEEEPDSVPSKLEELLAKREWADSVPKELENIPGIDWGLVNFVESEMYINSFDDFYAALDYLGEADIYSVSNKNAEIYTVNGADWMQFCWKSSSREPDVLIMYMEPSVISSDFSRETLMPEVVQMLGEPTNIYYDNGWSDFNFFQKTENVLNYEWNYKKEKYEVNVRFFFCAEKIIDYCQVIIEVI